MGSSKVISGRPFGGCAIIWKNDFLAVVNPLKNQSNRVCAVNISMNSYNILLCNVYLPVYNMPVNTFIGELDEVFNDLSSLINDCNVDHVVIGGDFNTSFF